MLSIGLVRGHAPSGGPESPRGSGADDRHREPAKLERSDGAEAHDEGRGGAAAAVPPATWLFPG